MPVSDHYKKQPDQYPPSSHAQSARISKLEERVAMLEALVAEALCAKPELSD